MREAVTTTTLISRCSHTHTHAHAHAHTHTHTHAHTHTRTHTRTRTRTRTHTPDLGEPTPGACQSAAMQWARTKVSAPYDVSLVRVVLLLSNLVHVISRTRIMLDVLGLKDRVGEKVATTRGMFHGPHQDKRKPARVFCGVLVN